MESSRHQGVIYHLGKDPGEPAQSLRLNAWQRLGQALAGQQFVPVLMFTDRPLDEPHRHPESPDGLQRCAVCRQVIRWQNGEPFTREECISVGHWCQRCDQPICDGPCHHYGEGGFDELCDTCLGDLRAIQEQGWEAGGR